MEAWQLRTIAWRCKPLRKLMAVPRRAPLIFGALMKPGLIRRSRFSLAESWSGLSRIAYEKGVRCDLHQRVHSTQTGAKKRRQRIDTLIDAPVRLRRTGELANRIKPANGAGQSIKAVDHPGRKAAANGAGLSTQPPPNDPPHRLELVTVVEGGIQVNVILAFPYHSLCGSAAIRAIEHSAVDGVLSRDTGQLLLHRSECEHRTTQGRSRIHPLLMLTPQFQDNANALPLASGSMARSPFR